MERPGSDSLSENHSVWALALQIKYDGDNWRRSYARVVLTILGRNCLRWIYRIVPSVCPVPGQPVWKNVWQSISGGSRELIVSNVFTLVAEEFVSLSLYQWYFWGNQCVIWRVWQCGIQSEGWSDVPKDTFWPQASSTGKWQKSGRQHGYVGRSH